MAEISRAGSLPKVTMTFRSGTKAPPTDQLHRGRPEGAARANAVRDLAQVNMARVGRRMMAQEPH